MATELRIREARIEPAALASAIASDVLKRAAETAVLAVDWLEEDGLELNQIQKVQLVHTTLRLFDGTERQILEEIERTLEAYGPAAEAFAKGGPHA